MGTIHVIGAGISGLACAVRCVLAGSKVALYEAAPQAGGRCRSFRDEGLGCLIDNGSHILLGANDSTRAFLADVGASGLINEIAPAAFPFLDIASGESWTLRPSRGPLPLWLFSPARRVPGSRPGDYLEALHLARADAGMTVADCVDTKGVLYQRLWQPLARAALNTDASEASARLLWAVIAATFFRGESACRPLLFSAGLSPTLVEPALRVLAEADSDIRYQARLRGIRFQNEKAIALRFPEGLLALAPDDAVVLAVPPDACAELWPDISAPRETRSIVNVHFRMNEPFELPGGKPFLGLVGAAGHWLFARGEVLSVTISAADELAERPNWELANQLWGEVARALGRNMGRVPAWRVIKERRATIAQTPAAARLRPGCETALGNLFIAGDWTDTGLPATIESAIRSGFRAARLALGASSQPEARE